MESTFRKRKELLQEIKGQRRKWDSIRKIEIPDNLFIACDHCKKAIVKKEMQDNQMVCPKCGHHHAILAVDRLSFLMDKEVTVLNRTPVLQDPLSFPGYEQKLVQYVKRTGMQEAVMVVKGSIQGHEAIVICLEPGFLMGSMGSFVGEAITRGFERAMSDQLPVIVFSASGGARMQEGILSLMQMAKTANAVRMHSERGLLYISCFTNPTTGGVTASFASLGDFLIAEPGALIGFAGPRVIKNTIGQDLPEGFQRSEFLIQHGFLDEIVERKKLRAYLSLLLSHHERKQ